MTKETPLHAGFYHFGTFVVPAVTGDPWNDPSQKCLVAAFTGEGQVRALCYRTDHYGVWFGYQIDDHPMVVAHNGHCLQNMGLSGDAADGMPCYLPCFRSPEDLSVACRDPLPFGRGVEPAEGNMLDWNVVWPAAGGRHRAKTSPGRRRRHGELAAGCAEGGGDPGT